MIYTIINGLIGVVICVVLVYACQDQKKNDEDTDVLDSIILNDLKEVTIPSARYAELLLTEIKLKEIKKKLEE